MRMTKKAVRYPIWSTRAILLASLPVVIVTTILVFWLSPSSVLAEVQITLSVISVCLFAFLTLGLYQGVRLERPRKEAILSAPIASYLPDAVVPEIGHIKVDVPGVPDAGDDLIGCLLTMVLWALVSIVLVAIFWLLEQFLITAFIGVAMLLYWVFYRALRIVFARSRACKGRLLSSAGYGLLYTSLYIGWIYAVIWISHYLIAHA